MERSLYDIYNNLTNDELNNCLDKAGTAEEKEFWNALILLRARNELVKMSHNSTQYQSYEMKSKSLKDRVSALNEAERKGAKKKATEVAKCLLNLLDEETISLKTGLSIDEIERLKS